MPERHAGNRGLVSWCLFDWAGQGFPTVIATFVFAAYFTKAVAVDEVTGTAQWGAAMSLSALAIALSGPVFGAVADRSGRRKPWILFFSAVCVVAMAMLWWVRPDPADVLWALVFVGIANYGFEMGNVFYNAMLPDLVPRALLGRMSGWGWGLGYVGGIVCLAVGFLGLVTSDVGWFGLDHAAGEHVRATAFLVAGWFVLFGWPMFVFTPDTPPTGRRLGEAAREGVGDLIATLRRVRDHAVIARFLLARMIYNDGLTTLFAFGGIYAAGTFGMTIEDIMLFGIVLNMTAGIGAALFAWLDDRIGPKPVILISVGALSVLGTVLLLVQSTAMFWVFGVPMGLFVGPAQAASRSYLARLAPAGLRAEMFGLFAFSGKVTAFLGPAALGAVTAATGSQRWGMAVIVVLFVVGMILLLPVPNPDGKER